MQFFFYGSDLDYLYNIVASIATSIQIHSGILAQFLRTVLSTSLSRRWGDREVDSRVPTAPCFSEWHRAQVLRLKESHHHY